VHLKPGYMTTEFWLTVAVDVAALIAAIADQLPPRYAALAATVSSGLYALARGWAKSSPALKPPPNPAPPAA
jgi:hypothetical protein